MAKRSDRPSCLVEVTAQGYSPQGPWDWEVHDKWQHGTVLSAEFRQTRDPKLSSLYWVILGKVYENTQFPSARVLHKALLVECGWVDRYRTISGDEVSDPMSITDMSADEFKAYFEQAMAVIHREWGIDVEKLRKEGRILLGGDL